MFPTFTHQIFIQSQLPAGHYSRCWDTAVKEIDQAPTAWSLYSSGKAVNNQTAPTNKKMSSPSKGYTEKAPIVHKPECGCGGSKTWLGSGSSLVC